MYAGRIVNVNTMRRTPRGLFSVLAVMSLSVSACGSPQSVPPYCESRIFIALPDAGAVTIVSVSTEPTSCGSYVGGTDNVVVNSASEGTCQVRFRLSNGNTYEFTVDILMTHSGRCGNVDMVVDASVPRLVDAGAT